MKKRHGLVAAILSVMCLISLLGASFSVAFAGEMTKDILNDDFSTESLSGESWYSANGYEGTTIETAEKPKVVVRNGAGGSSINSRLTVSADSVTIKLDVKKLIFGDKDYDSGWFGIAYNLSSYGESVYQANQDGTTNSDGLYFTYKASEGKLIFASMKGKATSFVDGEGNAIPQRTQWNFYDASALASIENEKVVINQKSLYFTFDNKGNAEVKIKTLDSDESPRTVIKTAFAALLPLKSNSYIGICCSETAKKLESLELSDFVIYSGSGENKTVYNEFSRRNVNNWYILKSNTTDEFNFGLDSSLIINESFSEDYPLVVRKRIQLNDSSDKFYSDIILDAVIKSVNLGRNTKFGFVFGLDRFTSGKLGDDNTTFIYFTQNSGETLVSAETYTSTGINELFADKKAVTDAEGNLNLSVTIDYKGKLNVKISGETLYSYEKENEAYAANYCALAVKGESNGLGVTIKSVKLTDTYYDRPENTDIVSTFDNDEYNLNEWNLMYTPYLDTYTNTAYVNNGKLYFENCAMDSAFVTKYQYSDYEIQFDIDDIRREVVGNGSTKSFPISSFVGVYWGVTDAYHKFGAGVTSTFPLVYIAAEVDQKTWDRKLGDDGNVIPVSIFAMGNGLNASFQLPDKYDFWSIKNADKVLQFKLSVTGRKVCVALRYRGETEWLTTDRNGRRIEMLMDSALTGNVAITTMGNNYYVKDISEGASCGHFSVDNVLVTNKDDNKNTVTVDFLTNKKEKPKDYDYVKPDNDEDYKPQGSQTASGCASGIFAEGLAMPIIALLTVAAFITYKRCKDE